MISDVAKPKLFLSNEIKRKESQGTVSKFRKIALSSTNLHVFTSDHLIHFESFFLENPFVQL